MFPVFPVAFNSSQASNVAKYSFRLASSNGNGTGAASNYLSKTFAAAGDCKKWTYSTWYRPTIFTNHIILQAGSDLNNRVTINNTTTGLGVYSVAASTITTLLFTSAYYMDPTSWYHVVVSFDSTQATASNKLKVYVNSTEQNELNVDQRSSITNTFYFVGSACKHHIGANLTPDIYSDCALTETTFVDGLQLTPSYFGAYDNGNNTWIPKKYNGNFGTNGFYLNYQDVSNAGKDSSDKNNNFTANNTNTTSPLSSILNDLTVDVPGNFGLDTGKGGEVRSNYSALNYYNKHSTIFIRDGALSATSTNIAYWRSAVATMGVNYGKWYCEFQWASGNAGGDGLMIGTVNETFSAYEPSVTTPALWPGFLTNNYGYYSTNGQIYNKSIGTTYGNAYNQGDIIGVAMDIDNRKIFFSRNGVWQNSGNPANGTNPAAVLPAISGTWFPAIGMYMVQSVIANFGQRPFVYNAPVNFKSFCTYNLSEPAIKVPAQYFRAVNYAGSNSSINVSTSSFDPDLVWIKNRSSTTNHLLMDTTRGAASGLASNSAAAQTNLYNFSFSNNGVNIPTGNNIYNNLLNNYISWNFKEGRLPGLDIVTYFGTGVSSLNVAHELGKEPGVTIIKNLSGSDTIWSMWHKSTVAPLGGLYWLTLNNTNSAFNAGAPNSPNSVIAGNPLGNTAPTSTMFNVGNNINPAGYNLIVPNIPGGTNWTAQCTNLTDIPYIAYLFSEVDGYSRFNCYTGNGVSNDGPFVWCGFKPAFIMVKHFAGNATGNWAMYDNARCRGNANNFLLYANLASQETAYGTSLNVDILSNGFKIKGTDSSINAAGNAYIFLAFAELPAKYSLAK